MTDHDFPSHRFGLVAMRAQVLLTRGDWERVERDVTKLPTGQLVALATMIAVCCAATGALSCRAYLSGGAGR